MKRSLLSLLSILALVLATSVCVYAQSDPDPSPAVQSGSEPGSTTGEMNDTGSAPPAEGSVAEPSSAYPASTTNESLPATASHVPLAFAIGLSALGAAAALRAYRRRGSF
jgi:hypothetical protein